LGFQKWLEVARQNKNNLRTPNKTEVIASEAKQSQTIESKRLLRRPDNSGLLAMTRNTWVLLDALSLISPVLIALIVSIWPVFYGIYIDQKSHSAERVCHGTTIFKVYRVLFFIFYAGLALPLFTFRGFPACC
jgi:hypothetical protein